MKLVEKFWLALIEQFPDHKFVLGESKIHEKNFIVHRKVFIDGVETDMWIGDWTDEDLSQEYCGLRSDVDLLHCLYGEACCVLGLAKRVPFEEMDLTQDYPSIVKNDGSSFEYPKFNYP